ncbi:M15 family metallopeptidase [Egicoccus sp. AB-alg2]|uniref:M15 family metallopeptidase n=1 Tax=Egicoccus sp. AB-alg2 TaxID=3242693 RepID=UPI00359DBDDA
MRSLQRWRRAFAVGAAGALLAAAMPTGTAAGAEAASSAVTAAAPATSACPVRHLPPTDFLDIVGAHEDGIRCLAWYGLANGRSADRFAPRGRTTRGQFASLLLRKLEEAAVPVPALGARAFDDTRGVTHGDAMERLHAAGLLRGTAPRTASPGQRLTRGQLATLIVAAVEYAEGRPLPTGPDAFRDDDGHFHEANIDRAAAAGLVVGRTATRYEPGNALRRDQTATVLTRTLDRFVIDGRLARPPVPGLRWEATGIPAAVRQEMAGVSMHTGCPVGFDDLRLVVLTHRGFDGRLHRGELVVHRSAVTPLRQVFQAAYDADFPLRRVVRIEHYAGSDDRSMAANNTSAFNCRRVTGGTSWSRHAYGTAIDLNPVQNPYVRGGTVLPSAGAAYTDRGDVRPGMLVAGDPVVRAFDAIGWTWGGRWQTLKDYQHFEAPS